MRRQSRGSWPRARTITTYFKPRHSGFLATPQRKRTALVVMRQALQGNVRPLRSVAGLFPAAQ